MHRQKRHDSKGEGDDKAEEEDVGGGGQQAGQRVGDRAVKYVNAHAGIERIVYGSGAPRQPALIKPPLPAKCGLKPGGVAAVDGQRAGQLGADEAHRQSKNNGNDEKRDENVEWTPPSHSVFEPYRPAAHVEKSDDGQAPNTELLGIIPAQQKRGLVSKDGFVFELKLVIGTVPAAHGVARVMTEK